MAQAGKGRLNYRCPSCFMRDLDIDMFYDEDKKEKLLEDGTLMKTPIVRNGRQATVGYQPDVWEQWE
mgnify:CR=1 FL=1